MKRISARRRTHFLGNATATEFLAASRHTGQPGAMDTTDPVTLETDIKSAIELYLTQITALQDVISSDPDNQKEAEMVGDEQGMGNFWGMHAW